jgi:hypothetical protein
MDQSTRLKSRTMTWADSKRVERYTVGFMHNKNDSQTKGSEAKAKPEVIKLGLDLHARRVTECRQLDGSTPKPGQRWDRWKLLDQVDGWIRQESKSTAATSLIVSPALVSGQSACSEAGPAKIS